MCDLSNTLSIVCLQKCSNCQEITKISKCLGSPPNTLPLVIYIGIFCSFGYYYITTCHSKQLPVGLIVLLDGMATFWRSRKFLTNLPKLSCGFKFYLRVGNKKEESLQISAALQIFINIKFNISSRQENWETFQPQNLTWYRQFRARSVLMLFEIDSLKTRKALSLYKLFFFFFVFMLFSKTHMSYRKKGLWC